MAARTDDRPAPSGPADQPDRDYDYRIDGLDDGDDDDDDDPDCGDVVVSFSALGTGFRESGVGSSRYLGRACSRGTADVSVVVSAGPGLADIFVASGDCLVQVGGSGDWWSGDWAVMCADFADQLRRSLAARGVGHAFDAVEAEVKSEAVRTARSS